MVFAPKSGKSKAVTPPTVHVGFRFPKDVIKGIDRAVRRKKAKDASDYVRRAVSEQLQRDGITQGAA